MSTAERPRMAHSVRATSAPEREADAAPIIDLRARQLKAPSLQRIQRATPATERPLRIAHIAPLHEAVPPHLYGGTERVVAHLADALVDLGHEVTLFASADTRTKARLIPGRDQALRLDPSPLKSDIAAHLAMLADVRAREQQFDILHFHVDLVHFPFFESIAQRTVTTLHGRLDLKDLSPVYRNWSQYPLVSISERQRLPLPQANWVATVHHGLPTDLYRPHVGPGGEYVAFLGRISPEKRIDRAIVLARRTGMPIKIAAKVDAADVAYYRERVEPLLRLPGVEFLGEIGDDAKGDFLGQAAALMFLIDWPEPFGLVMIESMACGTPVIAWNAGSVPEVVDDGITGFIVNSEDEAIEALHRIGSIDRRRVRSVFEKRFSAATMARNYEAVYRRQLARKSGAALADLPSAQ